MGWAYFQLGDLAEAERYLDRAIEWLDEEEDDESLAIIYDHAGDIAQAQGRRSEARGHWARALEHDPANAQLIEKLSGKRRCIFSFGRAYRSANIGLRSPPTARRAWDSANGIRSLWPLLEREWAGSTT